MRKLVLTFALVMLPATAFGQGKNTAPKAPSQDHKVEMKQHEMFVQTVLNKRAELKLTDAQVARIKAVQLKMEQHHKAMMQADMKTMKHDSMKPMKPGDMKMNHDSMMKNMKPGAMPADDLHNEFMAIFTPAQRKQVDAMMKAHMAQCAKDGNQCKMDMSGMKGMEGMKNMKEKQAVTPEKKEK